MEVNNLVFYNHFGAGDVYESREFVKEWMTKIKANEYFYAHGKNPKILRDIPELKYTEVTPIMHPMNPYCFNENNLYVNTWIGRDGKYVLPGIGCTVEKLYDMHNDILGLIGLSHLEKPKLDYIPSINYSVYNNYNTDKWLEIYKNFKKVLISNGPVQSNQAANFDFTPVIDLLCENYPDIIFIITQPIEHIYKNLFTTHGIIKDKDGFDLNEISYLSLFCDISIGRSSGPHVYTQCKENCFNPNKINISFTYKPTGGFFVYSSLPMKKYWSGSVESNDVYNDIRRVIESEV